MSSAVPADDPRSPAVDPSAIESKRDLAAQLQILRTLAGEPTLAVLARMATTAGGKPPSRSTVSNWLSGATAAQNAQALRQLVSQLVARAALPDAEAVTDAYMKAYAKVAEERTEERKTRTVGKPADPVADTDTSVTVPARSRRRWILPVVATAVAVAIGAVVGFVAAQRVVHPPSILAFAPCAETIRTSHASGYVQLAIGYGPPGDPYPGQRIELRLQPGRTGGWVAYAYLARSTSAQDEVWLDWSYLQDPDQSQVRTCDGQLVNQVRQTPGLLARDSGGWPRWLRACASVPERFQVPGRSTSNCTSWSRPDD